MFETLYNTQKAVEMIVEAVRATNRSCLLLLAGGSNSKLYAPLRNSLREDEWKRVVITLTDERYGAPGHVDSNWPTVEAVFADCGCRLLPVLKGGGRAEDAGEWEKALRIHAQNAQVITLLGVGTDAHTSGIKPYSSAAKEKATWVASYEGEDFERITTTPVFFRQIDRAIVYLEGVEKQTVFKELQKNGDVTKQPMQNIKLCKRFDVFYNVSS